MDDLLGPQKSAVPSLGWGCFHEQLAEAKWGKNEKLRVAVEVGGGNTQVSYPCSISPAPWEIWCNRNKNGLTARWDPT